MTPLGLWPHVHADLWALVRCLVNLTIHPDSNSTILSSFEVFRNTWAEYLTPILIVSLSWVLYGSSESGLDQCDFDSLFSRLYCSWVAITLMDIVSCTQSGKTNPFGGQRYLGQELVTCFISMRQFVLQVHVILGCHGNLPPIQPEAKSVRELSSNLKLA